MDSPPSDSLRPEHLAPILILAPAGVYSNLSAYERDGVSRALIPPAMASTQVWGYPRGPIICSTEGLRKESFCYLGTLMGLLFNVLNRITKNPIGFLAGRLEA